MSTVLWGIRKGDVQYGGWAYWRTHLPFGVPVIQVSADVFTYMDVVQVSRTGEEFRVKGCEPGAVAVEPIPGPEFTQ